MSQLNSTTELRPAKVVTVEGQIRVSAQPGAYVMGLNVFGTYAQLDSYAATRLIMELQDAFEVAHGYRVDPL